MPRPRTPEFIENLIAAFASDPEHVRESSEQIHVLVETLLTKRGQGHLMVGLRKVQQVVSDARRKAENLSWKDELFSLGGLTSHGVDLQPSEVMRLFRVQFFADVVGLRFTNRQAIWVYRIGPSVEEGYGSISGQRKMADEDSWDWGDSRTISNGRAVVEMLSLADAYAAAERASEVLGRPLDTRALDTSLYHGEFEWQVHGLDELRPPLPSPALAASPSCGARARDRTPWWHMPDDADAALDAINDAAIFTHDEEGKHPLDWEGYFQAEFGPALIVEMRKLIRSVPWSTVTIDKRILATKQVYAVLVSGNSRDSIGQIAADLRAGDTPTVDENAG